MNTIDEAAQALEGFANGPGADAANALADVFEQAGDRIASSLERAATSGELSFNALAESVLSDLARIAVTELITAPLQGAVSALTSSIAGRRQGNHHPLQSISTLRKARVNPADPKPVQRKWRRKLHRRLAVHKPVIRSLDL